MNKTILVIFLSIWQSIQYQKLARYQEYRQHSFARWNIGSDLESHYISGGSEHGIGLNRTSKPRFISGYYSVELQLPVVFKNLEKVSRKLDSRLFLNVTQLMWQPLLWEFLRPSSLARIIFTELRVTPKWATIIRALANGYFERNRERAGPNWVTVFPASIRPCMKNCLFEALQSSCNLDLWVCVGPKGLLHIGSDTFDFQVLFPQIEDNEPLSRFVHLIL
jgi:hypothetical protein